MGKVNAEKLADMKQAVAHGESKRSIARRLQMAPSTVTRALSSKVRKGSDFQRALTVHAPTRRPSPFSWTLETIRQARDQQMRGEFKQPARLAEAMRTDDSLFVAYHNRIAPQSAVDALITPHNSTRGEAVAKQMKRCVATPRSVLGGLVGTLANHGVSIGYVRHHVNDTGTEVHMRLTEWPIEHVRWNETLQHLETQTAKGVTLPITHGNSRWIVFRKFDSYPWLQEACVLPAALLWAAHANGLRDWASASTSHGQAKIVGELPEGVPLQADDDSLSPSAEAFLSMLQDLVSGEAGAGVRPAGAKTDFLANGSTAWQVFKELLANREKAAARIYLGTDAILGAVGGSPGVDISQLFGVASTKIQGDLTALEQGLRSGLYEPWTAIQYGDSRLAPGIKYQMPDPDEEKSSEESANRLVRLLAAVRDMRTTGMIVTQRVVAELAKTMKVAPVPELASTEAANVPLELAPTDVARVVKVREARASQGLGPLGDERDGLFLSELEAAAKGKVDAKVAEAETEAEAEADVKVAEETGGDI